MVPNDQKIEKEALFFNDKVSDELNSYLDRDKWEAKARSLAADGGTNAAGTNPEAAGKSNFTDAVLPRKTNKRETDKETKSARQKSLSKQKEHTQTQTQTRRHKLN